MGAEAVTRLSDTTADQESPHTEKEAWLRMHARRFRGAQT